MKRNGNVDDSNPQKRVAVRDEEEDDMFSDNYVLPQKEEVKVDVNVSNEITDDAEGYYKIHAGDVLDKKYKVVELVGKGVFASVAKAEKLMSESVVAVKIIRNNSVMHKAGLKEVNMLKKLRDFDDNNHVIKLIENFEFRNHLCLVFECMSMNLRDMLGQEGKRKRLDISTVQHYAKQLFNALLLLRKANIIHADIKPDNILVSADEKIVKLADFGSAFESNEQETTPYLVSRYYRAPEIILGIPYSYAIDVWSMACTLDELYSGSITFKGRSNNEMLKQMMGLKGRFPLKVLRKGAFSEQHFSLTDNDATVLFLDRHVEGQNTIKKYLPSIRPEKDLKHRILSPFERAKINSGPNAIETMQKVQSFIDFLERCFMLNPDKRLTPLEATIHSFLK